MHHSWIVRISSVHQLSRVAAVLPPVVCAPAKLWISCAFYLWYLRICISANAFVSELNGSLLHSKNFDLLRCLNCAMIWQYLSAVHDISKINITVAGTQKTHHYGLPLMATIYINDLLSFLSLTNTRLCCELQPAHVGANMVAPKLRICFNHFAARNHRTLWTLPATQIASTTVLGRCHCILNVSRCFKTSVCYSQKSEPVLGLCWVGPTIGLWQSEGLLQVLQVIHGNSVGFRCFLAAFIAKAPE